MAERDRRPTVVLAAASLGAIGWAGLLGVSALIGEGKELMLAWLPLAFCGGLGIERYLSLTYGDRDRTLVRGATDVTAASVAGGMATYAAFLSYFFAGIFALLAAAPLILGMKSIFDLSEKESEALVTGPLAVLWGLIVLAVWWVPLALTLPVAVHERRGPVSASVRSIALVAGRPRTALRHLAISYLLIVVLALVGLIVAVDGASAADAVAGLVISAIAVPLIAEALEGAYRALSGRDPAMVGE